MKQTSCQVNMRYFRRLLAVVVLCALLLAAASGYAAASVPSESSRDVDLTVAIRYEGLALPGAEVSVYRVGDMNTDGSLILYSEYAAQFDVTTIQSRSEWEDISVKMSAYCREKKTPLR